MLRNQELQEANTKVKMEIARLKIALQKEVGDDVDMDTIMDKETWKGRAQQILLLKAKIKDLQRQIDIEKAKTANIITSPETNTIYLPAPLSQSPRVVNHVNPKSADEKNAELLEKMEKDSKNEAIDMKKQLMQKTEEIKAMKTKQDGTTARNKILEQQVSELKLKITYVSSITLYVTLIGASLRKQKMIISLLKLSKLNLNLQRNICAKWQNLQTNQKL